MKKKYDKPRILVEEYNLDMPVSLNCVVDKEDMLDILEFGYFAADFNCDILMDEFSYDDKSDTICYHSNIQQAFLS